MPLVHSPVHRSLSFALKHRVGNRPERYEPCNWTSQFPLEASRDIDGSPFSRRQCSEGDNPPLVPITLPQNAQVADWRTIRSVFPD